MRKLLLLTMTVLMSMSAWAQDSHRSMLEQGRKWFYFHHHFESTEPKGDGSQYDGYEHTLSLVSYELKDETVINGQTYRKVYRHLHPSVDSFYTDDEGTYYAAYREEDGKVYAWDSYAQKDFLLIDFTMQGYKEGPKLQPVESTINTATGKFRRYQYVGTDDLGQTYTSDIVGVEGIGFNKTGLVHYLFGPEVDCICDYEEFIAVYDNDYYPLFTQEDFNAPKEITLTADERQQLKQNNHFAFNLFREARENKNMVLSPLSITYALGMMNNGAAGKTLEEINNVLGFADGGADAINSFCRKLMTEMPDVDPKTRMTFSNTIFVNEGKGYQLQDGFVEKALTFYDATPQARDFADGMTRDVINQWASDHTEGMIEEILTEEDFDKGMVSYLLNALYFKGIWSSPFDETNTHEEDFNGQETVQMMNKEMEDVSLVENDLYRAANLPYGNGGYTMTVFLPNEGNTIDDVLQSLSDSEWPVKSNRGYDYLYLKMPRFETQTDLYLKQIMKNLGMPTAFSLSAEFPYFCNSPVYIDFMKQAAKIEVNEKGTEAAAVTIIGDGATSIPSSTQFYLNRPFLYVISEQSTHAILFIGQYVGEHPTGISQIPSPVGKSERAGLYNLQGQRLTYLPMGNGGRGSNLQPKGVYVKDGRKVIITR